MTISHWIIMIAAFVFLTACGTERVVSEVEEGANEVNSYKMKYDYHVELISPEGDVEYVVNRDYDVEGHIDWEVDQAHVKYNHGKSPDINEIYVEGENKYSVWSGDSEWRWVSNRSHAILDIDELFFADYQDFADLLRSVGEQEDVDLHHDDSGFSVTYLGSDEEVFSALPEGFFLSRTAQLEDRLKEIEIIVEIDDDSMFIRDFQFRLYEESGEEEEGTIVRHFHVTYRDINETGGVEKPEGAEEAKHLYEENQ